jgi:hypothetical protein
MKRIVLPAPSGFSVKIVAERNIKLWPDITATVMAWRLEPASNLSGGYIGEDAREEAAVSGAHAKSERGRKRKHGRRYRNATGAPEGLAS